MVLAAARGENTATLSLKDDTKTKLDGDIDIMALENELKLLKNIASASMQKSFITLSDLSKILTPVMRGIYKNVSKLIQLYMTIPMSNATAERSFSCLRRLKNYLRNSLTQEYLNHRMFLHIHKDLIDQVGLASVCQEFITVNDRRFKFFGKKFANACI